MYVTENVAKLQLRMDRDWDDELYDQDSSAFQILSYAVETQVGIKNTTLVNFTSS